jgi:CheY-like chemotaxis protein
MTMPETPEVARSAPRDQPLVLVVEDQNELRHLYAQQLTLSGFLVMEAANGQDAIEYTDAHKPDYVLKDLILP